MTVFDSTILIAHLRGIEAATALVAGAVRSSAASASVLCRVEIEGAMRTHERADVARLFAAIQIEPVSDLIAARAGEFARRFRRSHPGIDLVDYVIAATADVLDAELATLNVKNFPMFKRLRPAF